MFSIYQNGLLVYLIATVSMKNVSSGYQRQENVEISQNISEALVEIINTMYVDELHRRMFNFHVKVKSGNKKYLPQFLKIVDEAMLQLKDNISILLRDGIAIPADNERHFCVLLVDSAESLEFLYTDLSKFHLFIEGSFFIVLQTFPNVHHYYDELFEIFQLNWRNGIAHADVLIYAVQNVILLFHSMPFTPFHCKGVAPIVHNKFIDGHWLHKRFYTPKTKNLFGCPLICATWEDMPYFELVRDRLNSGRKYAGIEGKLIEYLAERMNFTLTMRWLNAEEINQTVYDEHGVFQKLFEANTDFVVGAFHYKPTSLEDQYAPTTYYYMSNYYFIVSSKTDAYDSLTKLLLPFERDLWLILICIFVFVTLFLFVLMLLNWQLKDFVLGKENHTPAYNMVVVSLGGTVARDPKVPFSRYLLMLWLVATFVLRSVYQGFMFHYIKSDLRKPAARLIADLLSEEYRIFMSDVVYMSIAGLAPLVDKAEVLNTSELQSFEMIRHPRDYRPYKVVILTAMEYYGYYKLISPLNYDFYVVPEKLFTQQLSIYMKKNSVYLKRFNSYIENYVSEGLMDRWEGFLVLHSVSRRPIDDSPRPMKIAHLYAAYYLLFVGLSASLVLFLVEVFTYEIKILGRRCRRMLWKNSKK